MISFIIPAYNAEDTITRAIKSIADAGEDENYEIIIVENGSTDKTTEIIESFCQKNEKIRFIHSDKGVSKARNVALQVASGEWIVFVDSDDFLEEAAMETLQKNAGDSSVDFWVYGHKSGNVNKTVVDGGRERVFVDGEVGKCMAKMLENPTRYMQVWAKLFKKSIIVENNLQFNENLNLAEDSDFTLCYLKYCRKVCLSNDIIYHYSLDNPSTMRTYDGKKAMRYVYSMQESSKSVIDENDTIKKAFRKYVLMHMNIAMVREIYAIDNPVNFIQRYKQMKDLCHEEIFNNAMKGVKFRECFNIRMLPVLFLKSHLAPLAAMIFYLRAIQNNRRERWM